MVSLDQTQGKVDYLIILLLIHVNSKKVRVKDAEWLQLFIPKNNVSLASLKGHSDVIISSPEDGQNDDNAILEIWCKVFYVRELPSNI